MGIMSTEDRAITNSDDIIDSRDVTNRIQYLRDAWAESTGDDPADYALSEDDWKVGLAEDEAEELVALLELAKDGEDYSPDWHYGATLIRDSYFVEYAQELAEDIGSMPDQSQWPAAYIDWNAAADALRMDYTAVEFGDVTYWVR